MIGKFYRLAKTSSFLLAYYFHSLAAKVVIRDPVARRRFFAQNTGRYSANILGVMDFRITKKSLHPGLADKNFLIVSNHMSYLDILVMSSCIDAVFVTSVEVKNMILLGDLCEFGGSLFVERRNPKRILDDAQMIGDVIDQGFNLVIYPEGTTTNGETVERFKSSLLSTAIANKKAVLPVCIKYKSINGEPFSEENRDLICWYGDMEFPTHYYGLRQIFQAEVELSFLEPIEITPESDRRTLARQAEEMIRAEYHRGAEAGPGYDGRDDRAALHGS